jgi:predicted nuclease of restriction endonuclease-like (RecB) superfamily
MPRQKLDRPDAEYADVRSGIVDLLRTARAVSARSINAVMTATYWEIGRRIVESEMRGEKRADYGERLVEQLAVDLTEQFGRGFGSASLWRMRGFYQAWPDKKILATPLRESEASPSRSKIDLSSLATVPTLSAMFPLPWSAYLRLLAVKRPEARNFYEAEAIRAGWSVRQLDRQIGSQFYERIALSRNKAAMLEKAETPEPSDAITPEEAIKDPFVLEFLNLKDEYSESDLEEALIQHLADFLLELGDDFAFLGRQRRLRLDDTWFRIDLIFFHRRLRSLLIIDLKVGKFGYADAGQMHLYLNYAREHWMKAGENPPVGLILCTEKGVAEAHYALDNLPNKVLAAEYRTVLPDERLIAEELERSQAKLEVRRAKILPNG